MFMGGMFWLFIVGLFYYVKIFYYLYVDILIPLAGLYFCVRLNVLDTLSL
jgi:hypothetical protein